MYLVAGFESNVYVEMALHEIHECGIGDERITVIEMEDQRTKQAFFDSIHYSDGASVIDGMAACAVPGAVLGIVYGSQVKFGPLALGLLGFALGALIGFVVDIIRGNQGKWSKPTKYVEILLMFHCESQQQLKNVASICRQYKVITLGVHKPQEQSTS